MKYKRVRRIDEIIKEVIDTRYQPSSLLDLKKSDFMDNENIPMHDTNFLMTASYESLTKQLERTLDVFIIFENGDTVIEVPKGKGHRSKAIDKIMNYFIEQEDYEKCAVLRDLKTKIIEIGD